MRQGSITVFLALTLTLLLSFVFAMLEGARVACLQAESSYLSALCAQSTFANYHRGLWEDYHLLLFDAGDGQEFDIGVLEGMAMEEAERNQEESSPGWNLTRLSCKDVFASQYLLATDGKGDAFLRSVCRQMALEIPGDVLQELKGQREQSGDVEKKSQEQEGKWDQAWDAIQEAEEIEEQMKEEEEAKAKASEEGGEAPPQADSEDAPEAEEGEAQENPMDYAQQLKSSSMLQLVLPQGKSLSTKSLPPSDLLTRRSLQQGTMALPEGQGLQELTLWYYIQKYFSCFTGQSDKGPDQRSLDYEMEYLIAGRRSDGENLETVVGELLLIREALNFVTLMRDSVKKQTALAIATLLVGFTELPPLIKAVQIGILLAWAFVESVLDIRTLLDGGKIPLVKAAGQWSSDISQCRQAVDGRGGASGDEKGLSYAQYLMMLLFLHSASELSFRCMTLMEQNERVRMDHMVAAARMEFSYGAKPLFWNFNLLKTGNWKELQFSGDEICSYVGG